MEKNLTVKQVKDLIISLGADSLYTAIKLREMKCELYSSYFQGRTDVAGIVLRWLEQIKED